MRWETILHIQPVIYKDLDEGDFIGFFEGLASTPEIDLEGDRISPNTLEENAERLRGKPIMLIHGRDPQLGPRPVGEILDAVYEPERGLRIRAGIYRSFERIWSLIKSGILKALSIGGIAKKLKTLGPIREIEEAEITEVSLTPRGVNPSARILSFFGKSYMITDEGLLAEVGGGGPKALAQPVEVVEKTSIGHELDTPYFRKLYQRLHSHRDKQSNPWWRT